MATKEEILAEILRELEESRSAPEAAKPSATPKPSAEPDEMSALEVAGSAIRNIPSSGAAYGGAILEAITNPLDTLDAVTLLGAGALQELLPEAVVQFIGEDKEARELYRNMGQMLSDRYGGIENVKKTIATDPVGFMGDAATILGIGSVGLAKAATLPGKAGEAASKAASAAKTAESFVEPLSAATKAASASAGSVKGLVKGSAAATTGAGVRPLEEAFAAGREGGARAEQFRGAQQGTLDMDQPIRAAKAGLERLRAERTKQYQESMEAVGASKEIISFDAIDMAVAEAVSRSRFDDIITDEKLQKNLVKINKIIDEFRSKTPERGHTPIALDAMKQKIYNEVIAKTNPQKNPNARSASEGVYRAIKQSIIDQAPQYATAMDDYSRMSDLIEEIQKSLSLDNKASADTQLRKLQSVMRDNVNTNYGQRVRLAEELEAAAPEPFMPALAGQSLGTYTPRGMGGPTSSALVGGTIAAQNIPGAAVAAAMGSPRLVGNVAYGAGKMAGVGDRLSQMARVTPDSPLPFQGLMQYASNPLIRSLLFQAGRVQENR